MGPSQIRAAACGIVAVACACLSFGGAASASAETSAPANDSFASPIVLSGQSASRTGDTNVDATLETGEIPTLGGSSGGASVWYSWTAPITGVVRVDTLESDFDTLLGVYTGASVDDLSEVASNDDCCSGFTSRVRFEATAGATYRIRVDGFNNGSTIQEGAVGVTLFEAQHLANDDFATPTTISGQDVSRNSDTNEGATLQTGEAFTVGAVTGGASIWYSWTAPIDGPVTLDTSGSSFDTLLSVSTGTAVDNLAPVASGDDVKGARTSLVRFTATAATVYRIRLDGFGGDTGAVHLHLHEIPPPAPPANDDFANAIQLTGTSATRGGDTNLGATLEANEDETVGSAPAHNSVWYSWQAPVDGQFTIDTATSSFDTALAVYTGTAADQSSLTEVASNDDGVVGFGFPDFTSTVTFHATAGTVYRIRVDGYLGDTGTINLYLGAFTTPGAPANVTAVAVFSSTTVSWTAPGDGGTPIIGYKVTALVGGVATKTVTVGAVTQTVVTGLTSGATYTFTVTAVNSLGPGTPSSESNPVVPQKQNQTIAVATHAPTDADYGSSFSVTANAPAGAVTFSSAGACTNVGALFTMASGTGTCSVRYDQTGGDDYNAAPQVVESVTAHKIDQTISVSTHAPVTAALGSTFSVAATAPGGAVTFSSSGSCTNVGPLFTMTSSTGTCSVFYDQSVSLNYNAAAQVVESVTAARGVQTISVSTPPPASAAFGSSFAVAATGGDSGNPVTFSSAGACTNAGATFTMTAGTGTCSVRYDQAGNADFDDAPQAVGTLTATRAGQAIAVTKQAPVGAAFGSSFSVAATAPAGAVTFSSAGACTNVGAMFTLTTGTGTCSVRYDQAGDANYDAATQVVESVTAQKLAQAITVTTPAPASGLTGSSFSVGASAPGGTVTFSSSGSCTHSGATFTLTGVGTCSVKFDQSGNASYAGAPQVTESVSTTIRTFALTVTRSGSGNGSVTGSTGGIDCGGTCAATVTSGTVVTLTASAASGSLFAGWSGACNGVGSCTVTVTADQSVTASFATATSAAPTPASKRKVCVVPNLKGKALAAAKRKLAAAHCKAGKTSTARSKTVKKGSVVSQTPGPGKKLASGAAVALVLSRGR